MAKGTRHAPALSPPWPFLNAPTGNPSFVSAITLDAVSERVICCGYVLWADGGTHDLRSVKWLSGGTSLTGTCRMYAAAVDLTAGPPMRDDGVQVQFVDIVNPASGTAFTSTFGSDVTNVATGDEWCIVFVATVVNANSIRVQLMESRGASAQMRGSVTSFLGSVYAAQQAIPTLTLVASDGTLGILTGGVPRLTGSPTTVAFNSGSTPDERALTYVPTEPHWGATAEVMVTTTAGGAFDVVLYEGTTAKATKSFDANTWQSDASVEIVPICFPDVPFTVGNTYYLAVKPTTTTNVTIYLMPVTSGDLAAFAKGYGYATRTDAGAWSAVDATNLPFRFNIGIVADEDGAGGGSGGNANILRGSVVA